jgi:hypothetical protein
LAIAAAFLSAKYFSSSPRSFSRSFSPIRSFVSVMVSPSQPSDARVQAVAQATCPMELVRQEREAEEDQEQPRPGHERQAEHAPGPDQRQAQNHASQADDGLDHGTSAATRAPFGFVTRRVVGVNETAPPG